MIWFQAAFDSEAEYGKQWVVLRMSRTGGTGRDLYTDVVSRWPTRHEAEGHARKTWEPLRG